jgi:hypothetical protein
MGTTLSSLRVEAALDPSAYVSGMAAKISADQAGTDSSTKLANAITTTQTSFNGNGSSVDSLSKRFINGYGAANQFQNAVLSLGRATDMGAVSFQQQVDLLSGMATKYNLLADSGELAAKGYTSLSGAAQVVNDRFSSSAVAAEGAASKFSLVGAELLQTKTATSGTAAAISTLQNQFLALASGLGVPGVLLAGYGPAGIAAAAGISLVTSAFEALVGGADDLARKATALQSFATATGLTTDEIQGLNAAGAALGVTSDTVARDLENFASSVGQAQQGTGTLFDSLLKVNPQLALQVSGAKSVAQAWDTVAQAYQAAANSGNAAGAAAIGRAALGRSGAQAAPALLGGSVQSGGISQLGTQAAAAGDAIDSGLIARLTTLNAQLAQTKENATNAWESLFAEPVLTAELQFAEAMGKVVGVLTQLQNLSNSLPSATKGIGAGLFSMFGIAGAIPAALLAMTKPTAPPAAVPDNDNALGVSAEGLAGLGGGEASLTATSAALYAVQQKLISALAGTATPAQQLELQLLGLKKATDDHTLSADQAAHAQSLLVEAFNVTQLQANISAMGALATPAQNYDLAIQKLTLDLNKGQIDLYSFSAGSIAAKQAMDASTESLKENYGLASDADIASAAYVKYNNTMAALGATSQQTAAGLPALTKQITASIEAAHTGASALPQFTQMILDLQNANKTKDELLTSSGNALLQAAPAFVQALQQGQTIAQAIATSLTGAANSIANAFATAGAKQIAGSLLGGGSSSATNKEDVVSECSESDEVFRQDSDDQRYGHLSGRRNGRALGQQGSGVLENSSHRGNVRQLSAWRRDQKRAA